MQKTEVPEDKNIKLIFRVNCDINLINKKNKY